MYPTTPSRKNRPARSNIIWYTWKTRLMGGYWSDGNASRPVTVAWGFWYARTLSRHGMLMPVVVWVASSTQPNRYNGAQDVDCHRHSIEESLIGWLFVTSTAWLAAT